MAENKTTAAAGAPKTERKHITSLMRKIWGVSVFGEGFNMQPGQLYNMFFASDVLKVPPTVIAATTAIFSIVKLFYAPIGGALVDLTKPMKWGKLRSWLLIGSIISFATCWLNWFPKGTPTQTQWINSIIAMFVAIFYNAQVIGNFSLIPSITPYDEERHTLASNNMTGNKLGVLAAGFLVPLVMNSLLVPVFGKTSSTPYILIALICNAVMFGGYMVHFGLSKGYEGNGIIVEKGKKPQLTLKDAAAAIVAVPSLFGMVIADISSTVGAFLLPPFVVYLYKLVINGGGAMGYMAIHNLCIGIAGTIGSFTARYWLRKIKNKKNICLILYPCVAVAIFSARFFTDNVGMFIFCVAVAMFFQGTTNPVEATFYYDMAIVAQSKMGKDPTPTFIAIQQFGPGIAGIISTNVLSLTLLKLNYSPTAAVTEAVKAGFINGYSLVPGIICVIGWLSMLFLYRITPQKVAEARAIVAARGQELVKEEDLDD